MVNIEWVLAIMLHKIFKNLLWGKLGYDPQHRILLNMRLVWAAGEGNVEQLGKGKFVSYKFKLTCPLDHCVFQWVILGTYYPSPAAPCSGPSWVSMPLSFKEARGTLSRRSLFLIRVSTQSLSCRLIPLATLFNKLRVGVISTSCALRMLLEKWSQAKSDMGLAPRSTVYTGLGQVNHEF